MARIGDPYSQQILTLALQDERTKTILKWFSPLEMNKSQIDTFAKRHGQSGNWMLRHQTFLDWIDRDSKRMLWCPGNGKALTHFLFVLQC